jgi:MFS transporter, PAT family, beta-lactamase induction signal transducer AmpG
MKHLLQVFTNRRIAVTFLLGFSSGLPLPLVFGTLDAWMASASVPIATIGVFAFVQLPYTVKFLWAPLLDRYSPPILHRRTGWILIFQIILVVGIFSLGRMDPVNQAWTTGIVALIVAFFSASQDIVIDAYRAEVLRENELGAGAAVSVAGMRVALLTGGAIALILSDRMAWSEVYTIMASLMLIGIATTLFSPAPEKVLPPPKKLKEAVIHPFIEFFQRRGAILLLCAVLLYKLGDAVAGKMTTPFLIQTGFSKTDIGTINKGFGMIITIFGALWGGGLVAKMGIMRSLFVFGILQAVSNLVFVGQALAGKNYSVMVAAIGIENLCGGMGTAAFVAFLMKMCNQKFTATQFALLSSLTAVTRVVAGAPTGYLAENLGWVGFFLVSTVLAIPGILIILKLPNIDEPTSVIASEAKQSHS